MSILFGESGTALGITTEEGVTKVESAVINTDRNPDENGRLTGSGWARKPVVYVVQEDPTKNMSTAQRFGDCVALLEHRQEATMLNIRSITRALNEGLADFGSGDFLLLSGNPVSIGIAFVIAHEKTLDRGFNILKWDPQDRCYWKARITL